MEKRKCVGRPKRTNAEKILIGTQADRLREVMNENNISQYKLAKETGISQSLISQILAYEKSISKKNAEKIASYLPFGYSPNYFTGESEYKFDAEEEAAQIINDIQASLKKAKVKPWKKMNVSFQMIMFSNLLSHLGFSFKSQYTDKNHEDSDSIIISFSGTGKEYSVSVKKLNNVLNKIAIYASNQIQLLLQEETQ